jgi:lipoprotein-releasing system permease protein
VVVGVALLNCVISVMTGFEADLREKILGANAHIVVLRYGGTVTDYDEVTRRIEAIEGVEAAAPFVYSEMMIRSPWAHTGVILKGIDPERTGRVTEVRDSLTEGYRGALTTPQEKYEVYASVSGLIGANHYRQSIVSDDGVELPSILIGGELAEQLDVSPGDKVQLVNPLGGGAGPMGMPTPSVMSFRVGGIYVSGMYEYDTKWTYISNESAQDFLKLGDTVNGVEVRINDPDDVDQIAEAINAELGYPMYVRHWKNLNQKLFAALELEKWVMGLILQMVVVNAALLIASTLIMMVLTKGREIAILKAIGASSRMISRIFIIEGSLIGLAGSIGGTVLGLIGCFLLRRYEYPLETDVYYLDTLPVVVEPVNVVVIAVLAFVICFLATLYPSYRGAMIDPVEGLRYE